MTVAYKAAKAWYDAKPADRSFYSDFDREEFTRGMVQSLAGHLEPFFKAEAYRAMRKRLILRPIPCGELVRFNWKLLQ